jgi:hypothetical protein
MAKNSNISMKYEAKYERNGVAKKTRRNGGESLSAKAKMAGVEGIIISK